MAEVRMPKLGESVVEGTVGRWLKTIGDTVDKYEALAEVVTDKVTAELPSEYVGVLTEILVQENETVPVGTLLAKIQEAGNEMASVPEAVSGTGKTVSPQQVTLTSHTDATQLPRSLDGLRLSPAVRRLVFEHRLDLSGVAGSGLGGRVTRQDVLTLVEKGKIRSPEPQQKVTTRSDRDEWVTVTPVRKTIARHLKQSVQEAPHGWMMVEVDVSPLVSLRQHTKEKFLQREGIELTYLPFFIQCVVEALKENPGVNAEWSEDHIVVHKDINVSLAIATSDALLVPVIHHADRLSICGIAQTVSDLAKRARSGRLTVDDMQGGTFTVNNTGAFGSILSAPILNYPQAAILSVESIVKRPVVVGNDSVAIRSMVNLCISIDHRILDGWITGQFMRTVKHKLESIDQNTSLY